MRAPYESFGGILSLDKPAATVYVDQAYMRGLGYVGAPLWASGQTYLSAPVTAHFAVTHRCPLGCRTCYNGSGAARSGELSTEGAKAVLDTLAGMGVSTVAFGGSGMVPQGLVRSMSYRWVHHRFVSDLTSDLCELAFVAQNEAKMVELARNQAANPGFL